VASRSLGALTLDIIARTGGMRAGMDQAARIAEDRSRKIERSMRRLGTAITGAFALVGGVALVRKIVDATIEQENVIRQLEARIAARRVRSSALSLPNYKV